MALSDYRIDVEKKEDGAWHEQDGFRFKVRGIGSIAWLEAQERITRQLITKHKVRGEVPVELRKEIEREVILDAGLLDWGGPEMVDDEGKPIPYSKEMAAEVLRDPELEAILHMVKAACASVAASEIHSRKEAAKN